MEETALDRDERQNDRFLAIEKDAQIKVLLNSDDADSIDLGRVLHNLKIKRRVFAWVVLLCFTVGVCGALLYYQFTQKPLTVSSVVTLNYEVPNPLLDPEKNPDYDASTISVNDIPPLVQVSDLTAPDGTELDLNQITSSNVLSTAISGLELSCPVTLSNLQDNIKIDRILTEDSRRQQEVAASMIQDKNTAAYTQVQGISLTYGNQFVVSLSNGFGSEDSRVKYYLTDSELRMVLDRILDAYNSYLFSTYADIRLPDDEISVIDMDELDTLESLDLLRAAAADLYSYCDARSDTIKAYRSWRTGRSLNDLMQELKLVESVSLDYLYTDVRARNIANDRDALIANYQYQMRNAQAELDKVNENIESTRQLLNSYKNDEVYVSLQETDTTRTTQTATSYYNNLVLRQADNYSACASLEATLSELQTNIDRLNDGTQQPADESINEELDNAVTLCHSTYNRIKRQMTEIMDSTFYTTYAEHSVAQGQTQNFIVGSWKKMALGGAAGIALACFMWFVSALAMEFRLRRKDAGEEKEATEA